MSSNQSHFKELVAQLTINIYNLSAGKPAEQMAKAKVLEFRHAYVFEIK